MSRPTLPRGLTLTEELEKLEQSITLTLQEIDSNFSKAHRIVTTSIIPLVEQYGEHSKSVWEASKFWKQFFEASANVSLSGYEELANDEDTTAETGGETTQLEDTTAAGNYNEETQEDDAEQGEHQHGDAEVSLIDDPSLTGSTPRPPATRSMKAEMQFAGLDSPYEKLKREMKGDQGPAVRDDEFPQHDEDEENTTQILAGMTQQIRLPDMSMTPHSSSILDEPTLQEKMKGRSKDPLLHKMLDKTYRIQATPHKTIPRLSPPKAAVPTDKEQTRRALWADSPTSSPEMTMPKLRTDLYSPVRAPRLNLGAPRTPGVSVQTPATVKKRDIFAAVNDKGKGKKDPDEITWESDEDETFGGMSPPKTIQFALPPSKLMQTPAGEASKRIVEDILLTAGAAPEFGDSEASPSMVKMNKDILDDTF